MDSSDDELLTRAADDWENSLLETGTVDEPSPKHLQVLLEKFGHRSFRDSQWKIIGSILNDRRDNCAIMATGYGKSLCYQFPAVYSGGISIVISPLISLMEDQVLALAVANIPACLLGTAQDKTSQTVDEIFANKYSVVYVTPELCTGAFGSDLLTRMSANLNVTMVAVDEAHCLSSWGHDFRHAYRNLGVLKSIFPTTPILAVTATATESVRKDIVNVLKLNNPQMVCTSFDRPNLYFSVNAKGVSILSDLKPFMVRENDRWVFDGPSIIYCIRRKDTEAISNRLKEVYIDALPYHAGLSLKVRKDTHEKFVRDKISVVVATIAFGMGIDKPDIRNVIHYGTSGSLEGYYQEVGRAGRDGLPSKCATFYSPQDIVIHRFMHEQSGNQQRRGELLNLMRDYLGTEQCRREFLLSYFEGRSAKTIESPSNQCCDNCSSRLLLKTADVSYEGLDSEGSYDFTEDAMKYLSAVVDLKGRFGHGVYSLYLRGSKSSRVKQYMRELPGYGSGNDKLEEWWKALGQFLEVKSYLKQVKKTNSGFSVSVIEISKSGQVFLDKKQKLVTQPPSDILKLLKKKATPTSTGWISSLTNRVVETPSTSKVQENSVLGKGEQEKESPEQLEERMRLYRLLKNCRTQLASANNCMPYMVATDYVLMEMSKHRPKSFKDLVQLEIDGFSEAKLAKFGLPLLAVIKNNTGTFTPTIQQVLSQHPVSKEKMSSSAYTTYEYFQNHKSVEAVTTKRGMAHSTVFGHLILMMKHGYPLKLQDLGVTTEAKSTIMQAINDLGGDYSLLTPIKAACPESITYDQIKAVCTYLQIRKHLKELQLPYEEFDEDSTLVVEPLNADNSSPAAKNQDTSKPVSVNTSEMEDDGYGDDLLLALCDEMEQAAENDEKQRILNDDSDRIVEVDFPPSKKYKAEELLDSPPREKTDDVIILNDEDVKKKDVPGPQESVAIQDFMCKTKKVPVKKGVPKWLSKSKRV